VYAVEAVGDRRRAEHNVVLPPALPQIGARGDGAREALPRIGELQDDRFFAAPRRAGGRIPVRVEYVRR
jgi:hypothetical protein